MPLELHPFTKQDAPELVRLIVAGYQDTPMMKIIFPDGMSQAGLEQIEKVRCESVDDDNSYVWKVVDTDTGEMAACATWTHTKAMSDEDWDRDMAKAMNRWPEANHDILDPITRESQDKKRRIMGHTRWWELESLTTLPRYQRRGIGSMLMKWGTDKLEETKVPGFILASEQGYGLYIKHGFHEVDRWEVDMGQWPQLGRSGSYKNVFLTRQPLNGALA